MWFTVWLQTNAPLRMCEYLTEQVMCRDANFMKVALSNDFPLATITQLFTNSGHVLVMQTKGPETRQKNPKKHCGWRVNPDGQCRITWLLPRCRKDACLHWSLLTPLLWWLRSDSCERKPWLPAHLRPAISIEQLLSCSTPQQFTPCGHRLSTLRDQLHRAGSLSPSLPDPSITIWPLFANACRRDAQPSSALHRRCEFRANIRTALMIIWRDCLCTGTLFYFQLLAEPLQ